MTSAAFLRLGVNIDHVATLRNARGGKHPDPLHAAETALAAGADGITAHLREDRRHIRDDDIARLKARLKKPLNLEMAATPEMIELAVKTKPHAACLVPERREERTTEGSLDLFGHEQAIGAAVLALGNAGIRVSLFIAPDREHIDLAVKLGAPVIEIHTGAWCDAVHEGRSDVASAEFHRIATGARFARSRGLEVHAGHGLDYVTSEAIAAIPEIVELNIGHFLVGDAISAGLGAAVKKMRIAMDRGRARLASKIRP